MLIAWNAVSYMNVAVAIVFVVIVNSLFSGLNNDVIGSLLRSGYMFLKGLLILILSADITVLLTFCDQTMIFKHQLAGFYLGRIAYIMQVVLDIPLIVLEVILLSLIGYFCGQNEVQCWPLLTLCWYSHWAWVCWASLWMSPLCFILETNFQQLVVISLYTNHCYLF